MPPPVKEGDDQASSKEDPGIRITADSPELDKFFAASAPNLFSEYYGTLAPVDRPAIETLTPLGPLRSLLGTIAVVSLPGPPTSTIDRETIGRTQPGQVTERTARAIEARIESVLRGRPVQSLLRKQVVAQARAVTASRILDGGVAPAHWRGRDYQRFAEQGVRTVLEVGMVSIDPVLTCFDGRCAPDNPPFTITSTHFARLVSVADRHVLWEKRYGSSSSGRVGDVVASLASDADASARATGIVKDIFGADDESRRLGPDKAPAAEHGLSGH